MKVTLLGTGTSQGIPVVACECDICTSENPKDKRLRCSVLIETQGRTLVIDSGPDFRYQMLRAGVKHLDGIIFTHSHKDHIAGLDDVRAFNFRQKSEINIYADRLTLDQIRSEFYYAFEEIKYPGVPEIRTIEIDTAAFEIEGIRIQPILVYHHLMPVLGFRLGNFAYVTDAKTIPEESLSLLQNLDILIINALRIQPHIAHFNLEEALRMVEILKPRKTYFTHISHLLGKHEDMNLILPEGIELAYDGLNFTL